MRFLKSITECFTNYRKFTALNKQRLPIGCYSETGSDCIYFKGIIRLLMEQYHQPVLYLTSSEKDPMLTYQNPYFHPVFVGSGLLRNIAFRVLNVNLFVMTLPDLESFDLKRSIAPVHYAYIFHSLVSTHMIYRDRAFDAYDTIFCVGPHHEAEIREAEQLFNLKPKTFVQLGYPRIDDIIEQYQLFMASLPELTSLEDKPVNILIAPSWGENSITNQCLHPLIAILLKAGYAVTFRPHPMTMREPDRIDAVRDAFSSQSGFALDLDISQVRTLFEADIMISDWSGVALEFALATEKPVLYVDVPRKLNNSNFSQFTTVPIEVSIRELLGAVVSLDTLKTVPACLQKIAANLETSKQNIAILRDKLVYNLGRSSEVGAAELMRILNDPNSHYSS
jgi:hypothetical protein